MNNTNQEIKERFIKSNRLRLKSLKDGQLRVGPEFVRIGVSKLCNFNCLTCWDYSPLLKKQISNKEKTAKIDKDLVLNLIDDLAEMQCLRILFSGIGEPFTHPNMLDFIKRTREKEMLVYLQTNLSLVKDPYQLAKYLGNAANLVCVHLSAATPETYLKMHPNQTKKEFHDILDRVKVLRSKKVPVRLVYIVS